MNEPKMNPFAMCQVVRQRANELRAGAMPRVEVDSFDRVVSTAIREVQAGQVKVKKSR